MTTEKLNDRAVTTTKLNNGAVTTEKIADNAVTTEKLNNKSVTTEKLNNKSVTTEKLNDKSVTTEKIADNAVTTEKLNDKSVTTEKIAGEAINADHFNNDLKRQLIMNMDYDPITGIITVTAFDGTTRQFDFPVEKILKSVELKNETFVFTFADDTVIEVPVGYMLPVWTTDIENATDRELLIPPTAGAVKNILSTKTAVKINGEVLSEWNADNVLKYRNTTGGRKIVYQDPNGYVGGLPIDSNASNNTIVQRSASGEVYGNTTQSSGPTAFVTKDYLYWYTTTAENDTDLMIIPVKGPNNGGFFDVALNRQPLGIPQYDMLGQLSANTYPGGTGDALTNKDWVLANTARPTGFTADDVNKFVVVGPDGELVAKYIPTGGSY